MTAVATNLVFEGAVRMQLHRWLRRRLRHDVVILTYHGFTAAPRTTGVRNFHGKHVAASHFRRHLEYLRRHHTVVSLTELVRGIVGAATLPPRSVHITIDDGYRSTWSIAFPLLRELRLPASLFIATDFVGRKRALWPDRVEHAVATTTATRLAARVGTEVVSLELGSEAARITACRTLFARLSVLDPDDLAASVEDLERRAGRALDLEGGDDMFAPLRWEDVIEMQASGWVEVGSHSVTHPSLARCARDRQAEEIAASKGIIEASTGRRCDVFCYPHGQPGDFDESTKELVRRHGYRAGLTAIPGVNGERADPYALRRFTVTETEPFATFLMKMYGVVDGASRAKRAVRAAVGGGHARAR